MEGTSLLIWGTVFGAFGLGFFTYGKRQKAFVPLIVGIALFVVPYFIANVYMLVTAGAVLVALPYFVRI
jgi:predicted membrane protein